MNLAGVQNVITFYVDIPASIFGSKAPWVWLVSGAAPSCIVGNRTDQLLSGEKRCITSERLCLRVRPTLRPVLLSMEYGVRAVSNGLGQYGYSVRRTQHHEDADVGAAMWSSGPPEVCVSRLSPLSFGGSTPINSIGSGPFSLETTPRPAHRLFDCAGARTDTAPRMYRILRSRIHSAPARQRNGNASELDNSPRLNMSPELESRLTQGHFAPVFAAQEGGDDDDGGFSLQMSGRICRGTLPPV